MKAITEKTYSVLCPNCSRKVLDELAYVTEATMPNWKCRFCDLTGTLIYNATKSKLKGVK